jgi:hypothetical protein
LGETVVPPSVDSGTDLDKPPSWCEWVFFFFLFFFVPSLFFYLVGPLVVPFSLSSSTRWLLSS